MRRVRWGEGIVAGGRESIVEFVDGLDCLLWYTVLYVELVLRGTSLWIMEVTVAV